MQQKLVLYIGNVTVYSEAERVDQFKDETVSFTQTIQNVKDIKKIFTEFTKTFSLPASKKNNKIFKHYYNFDIDNGFDARRKVNAALELNDIPYKTGKIALTGVDLKNNVPHTYKVTFYGNTVDLKDILGDSQLSSLTSLNDGRELIAECLGNDPNTDLALLKVDQKNLVFAEFGNSDDVKLGDWVLAVGNPFNLTSTVTAGIVSAKARNINILRRNSKESIFPLESFIQTDAAVNPGNSGGALVNPDGVLIGINTAIASKTGSYSGYSFAIPSNITLKVVNDLKKYGLVQRAFIGVIIQEVTQQVMDEFNLPNTNGVLVSGLSDGGAAYEAGIKTDDIILKVENIEVNGVPELQEQIGKFKPGDIVKVIIQRKGEKKIIEVKLRNNKGTTEIIDKNKLEKESSLYGAVFEELNKESLKYYNINSGIKIISLNKGEFKEIGIKQGFIVTHIDKNAVNTINDLKYIIKNKKSSTLIEGIYPNGLKGYFVLDI